MHRTCVLKHGTEGKVLGKVYVTRRRRRRSKQLLDGLKETSVEWELKEETLDHTLWRTRFGRTYGLVRQTAK